LIDIVTCPEHILLPGQAKEVSLPFEKRVVRKSKNSLSTFAHHANDHPHAKHAEQNSSSGNDVDVG
jgi:hypothetical protein